MKNHSPLPSRLTLDDAARELSDRLGNHWTARHVLGCAERGEISVFARIPIDARMVRCEPVEGATNEMVFPARSLPRISAATARALLCAPSVDYTEHTQSVALSQWLVGDGPPVYGMQATWRIAEGETPPEITMADCIVSDAGVLQLLDEYAEPVPAVVVSGPGEAESDSTAGKAPVGKMSPRKWWDVAGPYMVQKLRAGKFATAKALDVALSAEAGLPESPFDKGTGQHRGSLFVREISKPLSLKTIQNNWAKLRNAAAAS